MKKLSHAAHAKAVAAASSKSRPVYHSGTDSLGRLAIKHAEARDAIVAMSRDSKAHVRFNAILCLDKKAPKSFAAKQLRVALLDPSAVVRGKAADWALRIRARTILLALEAAIAAERHSDARKTMEFTLPLLRDGYTLEPEPGGYTLTVHKVGGVSFTSVSKAMIKKHGLKALIKDLRREPWNQVLF
jgi:hypothetical protein